jgi:hypothetical protein
LANGGGEYFVHNADVTICVAVVIVVTVGFTIFGQPFR